ncbi:hypothetical protein [Actinocrispum wychmicini]|uniref:Uncharacterized protein n=1 Tax=Actinocrispum wychmicini TaxID=1213861 RepID=A0A4R2IT90_9PSEU|nr:hypothetical protein [Actinocrispum wychmicini]TCO47348.1 hypothetical protein EV192_11788 [Actinocrispum wychmicini]
MRHAGVLITCLFMLLVTGMPASAHGGPIRLEVQGDGGQGVTATVTYQNDGHPVTDEVVLNFTAVTADGRAFGPVRMVAAAEGQSFYVSEQSLPVGAWTVTVIATRPSAATKTAAVTSKILPAKPTLTVPSNDSTVVILVAVNGVILLAVAAAILLRWRRTHS